MHHHHLGLMKTTLRRGHPLSVGHQHHPLPSYSTLHELSACRQEPHAWEDASCPTSFDLGQERLEVLSRRSTSGSCWGGTWELSAPSSPFPHHSSLLCTTHRLLRKAYWLSGSFPCPALPPLCHYLASPITE